MAILRRFWYPANQTEIINNVEEEDDYILVGQNLGTPIVSKIKVNELELLMKRVQELEERLVEIYLLDKVGDNKDV